MTTSTNVAVGIVAQTLNRLMDIAFLSERRVITDVALGCGLMWRCVCKTANQMDTGTCVDCGAGRLWAEDITPPRCTYGALLEDLRAGLKDWFDARPHERRPAAISFRVTTQYDDGPAWATWDTTAYFTDYPDGVKYRENFKRSAVADALVQLGAHDRPDTGDALRIAIPAL